MSTMREADSSSQHFQLLQSKTPRELTMYTLSRKDWELTQALYPSNQRDNIKIKIKCIYEDGMWRIFDKENPSLKVLNRIYQFMDDHALPFTTKQEAMRYFPAMLLLLKAHGLQVGYKKTKWMSLGKPISQEGLHFNMKKTNTYLGTEIRPQEDLEKVIKCLQRLRPERVKWKGWLKMGDSELETLAFMSYYFSRIAHKVLPYQLSSTDRQKEIILDQIEETYTMPLRKKAKYLYTIRKETQLPGKEPTYLEELIMYLQVKGKKVDNTSKPSLNGDTSKDGNGWHQTPIGKTSNNLLKEQISNTC